MSGDALTASELRNVLSSIGEYLVCHHVGSIYVVYSKAYGEGYALARSIPYVRAEVLLARIMSADGAFLQGFLDGALDGWRDVLCSNVQ